jgi:hypothetical protein
MNSNSRRASSKLALIVGCAACAIGVMLIAQKVWAAPSPPSPQTTAATTKGASSDQSTAVITPSTDPVRPSRAGSPPSTVKPSISVISNPNSKAGSSLAQLCWFRQELVLSLVKAMVPAVSISAPSESDPQSVARLLGDWQGLSKLPVNVRPFAAQLQSDALRFAAIARVEQRDLATLFDMEKYPAAAEYAKAASNEPGCARP